MPDFIGEDLSGARFENVNLAGARFVNVALNGVVIRGAWVDMAVDGLIDELVVNGIDVVPLVEAELDRRYPDRVLMRPTTAAEFRAAWDVLERLWDGTVSRARSLPPALLHERVDAASPGLRHGRVGPAGVPGRALPLAPARPAARRDAR
jgi:hypothetical protein